MKELLPIGSVIKTKKDSVDPLMIIGYYPIEKATQKLYEYLGTVYPRGMGGGRKLVLLNEQDTNEVLFDGYKNESACKIYKPLPAVMKAALKNAPKK